jgi:hypothetical protein
MRDLQAQFRSVALAQAVVHQEIEYATYLHRQFPCKRKKAIIEGNIQQKERLPGNCV